MEYSTSTNKLYNINKCLVAIENKMARIEQHLEAYPSDVQAMQAQIKYNRVFHFYKARQTIQEMRVVACEYLAYRRKVLKCR